MVSPIEPPKTKKQFVLKCLIPKSSTVPPMLNFMVIYLSLSPSTLLEKINFIKPLLFHSITRHHCITNNFVSDAPRSRVRRKVLRLVDVSFQPSLLNLDPENFHRNDSVELDWSRAFSISKKDFQCSQLSCRFSWFRSHILNFLVNFHEKTRITTISNFLFHNI